MDSNSIININHITKKYSPTTGLFDVNLDIKKGETIAIIGVNGAGKTTLLRTLMGFVKPKNQTKIFHNITIDGLNPWKDSAELKNRIAYIPGEIGFPQLRTGLDFIKNQAKFENVNKLDGVLSLTKKFYLDINAKLKTMSKGMKQKTAIISAFIRDKDILIFDEPTTGLDPLMRDTFIDLILEQKALGKTIIFSTHIFLEAERTCDRALFLDQGRLFEEIKISDIIHNKYKEYRVGFEKIPQLNSFINEIKKNNFELVSKKPKTIQCIIKLDISNTNKLMNILAKYKIAFFSEIKYTLDKHFLSTYSAYINKKNTYNN